MFLGRKLCGLTRCVLQLCVCATYIDRAAFLICFLYLVGRMVCVRHMLGLVVCNKRERQSFDHCRRTRRRLPEARCLPTHDHSKDRAAVEVSTDHLGAFGHMMRERLTTGDIQFRKAYRGTIIGKIEGDDHHIRVVGRKDCLEQAVIAGGQGPPLVRSFVRNWRTRQESNLRPLPSEGNTLSS
jgi:hypothetical protein